MPAWVEAKVSSRCDWDDGLMTLKTSAQLSQFKPGQFVNLALEIDGQRVRRPYSVASAPGSAAEFFLSRVPDGDLSPRLFSLQAGDSVWMESVGSGLFTLDWLPETATDLWLLATGTGLGPFISFLRSDVLFPRFQRIVVVHGARFNRHHAYAADLEQAAVLRPSLTVLRYVTRESPALGAHAGRVTEAIESGQLERAAGVSFGEHSHIMLCGNPAMIKDANAALMGRGLRKHRRREPGHITLEKYW